MIILGAFELNRSFGRAPLNEIYDLCFIPQNILFYSIRFMELQLENLVLKNGGAEESGLLCKYISFRAFCALHSPSQKISSNSWHWVFLASLFLAYIINGWWENREQLVSLLLDVLFNRGLVLFLSGVN